MVKATLTTVLFQVLVTHHVELVLPGTHYLVRMLDGRISEQGLVADLRKSGKLDQIIDDAELQTQAEAAVESLQELAVDDLARDAMKIYGAGIDEKAKKKPRKLVEDERREAGAVKWGVYKEYLKAS
jgi:ABC-type methionine transport system ATPase subunit